MLLAANNVLDALQLQRRSPTATRCGQLGAFGVNSPVQGWGRYDEWQYQMTATKAWPRILGSQQLILLGEVGVTVSARHAEQELGGPNGQGLVFEAPGTFLAPNRC